LVGEGRCDNPPSAPTIVLTHHAEISPWCGWHQAPTRLPECGTPGLEEYPREGNKQQASAGRQKSMRCPHSSCTVALCRNAGTGGTITVKPGTASKTPRSNWRHCCGAVALFQLRTFSRLEQKLVVVSARCRGLHAVIIEMACSCIDTDSGIEFPGASKRKAHDPIICVDNFRRHGRGIPTWSVTPSILISWPKPLFLRLHQFHQMSSK